MQQDKKIIYYETSGCKVYWKYKTFLDYDFDKIRLKDIWVEKSYCYGIENYIKNFAECIKEKVIRYLPNLDKIEIKYGIFDKNNLFHIIVISVIELMEKILKKKIKKEDYYKSIFVEIKYQEKIVFFGSLNFDRLI